MLGSYLVASLQVQLLKYLLYRLKQKTQKQKIGTKIQNVLATVTELVKDTTRI